MLAVFLFRNFCFPVWYPLTQMENIYAYNCHNKKHFSLSLAQYKTSKRNTVTIPTYAHQDHNLKYSSTADTMEKVYTYHCHYTNTVHVPLSLNRHCTRTTVTTQIVYMYHCHNTDCTRTTVITQIVYIYHCH
jgi:hypothetical protein